MRKALVILIVLFGVFLAIGCAGQKGGAPNQTVTPVEAITPAEAVTPVEAVTPAEAVTPVEAVTPENYTATENKSSTGTQNVTKHVSSTQRKKARIIESTQTGNNTSGI
jgi:hypothetical protein